MKTRLLYLCLILSGVGAGAFAVGCSQMAEPPVPRDSEAGQLVTVGLTLATLAGFGGVFLMPVGSPRRREPRL